LRAGTTKRGQAAVAVDAEHLEPFAAVGTAAAAGVTVRIVEIRLDGTAIARPDVRHAVPTSSTSTPVRAPDARITEERHLAEIAADVGAANADAMDANQCLAGTGALARRSRSAGNASAIPETGPSSRMFLGVGRPR
jgi:hypothetical protein